MIKLAIIGTSGRFNDDFNKLNANHFEWMANNVMCYITEVIGADPSGVILVSGGSAWADHVAVQLYLNSNYKFAGLELYLPSKFDQKYTHYVNTHEGRLLNSLHTKCKEKTGIDVLMELKKVLYRPGVKCVVQRGFHSRNTLIAKNCDHLIAFTFRESDPVDGGTGDTWKKVKHNNKIHFNLSLC